MNGDARRKMAFVAVFGVFVTAAAAAIFYAQMLSKNVNIINECCKKLLLDRSIFETLFAQYHIFFLRSSLKKDTLIPLDLNLANTSDVVGVTVFCQLRPSSTTSRIELTTLRCALVFTIHSSLRVAST